jgi:hypothetical protein
VAFLLAIVTFSYASFFSNLFFKINKNIRDSKEASDILLS